MKVSDNRVNNTNTIHPQFGLPVSNNGKASKATLIRKFLETAGNGRLDKSIIISQTQNYINAHYPQAQKTTVTLGDYYATVREMKQATTKGNEQKRTPPQKPPTQETQTTLPERLVVQRFTKEELLAAKNFIKEVGTARAEDLVQTVIEMMI